MQKSSVDVTKQYIKLQEINGELIILIPDDIVEKLNLNENDTLKWSMLLGNEGVIITKQ